MRETQRSCEEDSNLNYRTTMIICIVIAIACMVIGFINDGMPRLIFALIGAATITFALIYDIHTRKKQR